MARLAIPSAPRRVRLTQVPGAVRRLAGRAVVGAMVAATVGFGGSAVLARTSDRDRFYRRAVAIEGVVFAIRLPPAGQREGGTAAVDVLHQWRGRQESVASLSIPAELAEGLGPGAHLMLLLDPELPSHVEVRAQAEAVKSREALWPWVAGAALAVALALAISELLRTIRSDLQPLRVGALVWLTPSEPLPETHREVLFTGTYRERDAVKTDQARVRPGLHPVRNGEKVLAAVLSTRPKWGRVVDEELAKALGWIG